MWPMEFTLGSMMYSLAYVIIQYLLFVIETIIYIQEKFILLLKQYEPIDYDTLIILGAINVFIYLYFRLFEYFHERNIKTVLFPLPIIGNNFHLFFGYRTPFEHVRKIYASAKANINGIAGWFDMVQPVLCIGNFELVKKSIIEKSEYFYNRSTITTKKDFNKKSLFHLKGNEWSSMRQLLSPLLEDSYLPELLQHLVEVAKKLDTYIIKEYLEKKEKQQEALNCTFDYGAFIMEMDLKELFSRYTNDAILSCAFGLEQDSFNEDIENYKHGRNLTNYASGSSWFKFYLIRISEFLTSFFYESIYNEKSEKHLLQLLKKNLKLRINGKEKRDDILQLLVDSKKSSALTNDDIFANILQFYYCGFDTVSTCLALTAMQLAEHPHIQMKLVREMMKHNIFSQNESQKCFYDRLKDFDYMDCVIKESLRRCPVVVDLDRVCTKEYTIRCPMTNKKLHTMKKGERLNVPIAGFHHDPRYFKQPALFSPERHEHYNKLNMEHPNFLGFGAGHRKCLGYRFAQMEIKLALCYILRHFDFVATNSTPLPMKFKKSFEILPEPIGYMIGIRERNIYIKPDNIFYPTIISPIQLENKQKMEPISQQDQDTPIITDSEQEQENISSEHKETSPTQETTTESDICELEVISLLPPAACEPSLLSTSTQNQEKENSKVSIIEETHSQSERITQGNQISFTTKSPLTDKAFCRNLSSLPDTQNTRGVSLSINTDEGIIKLSENFSRYESIPKSKNPPEEDGIEISD